MVQPSKIALLGLFSLGINFLYCQISYKYLIVSNHLKEDLKIYIRVSKNDQWGDLFDGVIPKTSKESLKMNVQDTSMIRLFIEYKLEDKSYIRYAKFVEDTLRIDFDSFSIRGVVIRNEENYGYKNYFDSLAVLLNTSNELQKKLGISSNNLFSCTADSLDSIQSEMKKWRLSFQHNQVDYFLLYFLHSNVVDLLKVNRQKVENWMTLLSAKHSSFIEYKQLRFLLDSLSPRSIQNLEFSNLDYKKEKIDFREDKDVLLFFWTTSCINCLLDFKKYNMRTELSKYQKYAIRIGGDYFSWRLETERIGIQWKNLIDFNLSSSPIPMIYSIETYPTIVVINPKSFEFKKYESLKRVP